MPTPFPDPNHIDRREWRCIQCRKLLGVCHGARLHLRFARSHEVMSTLPAIATCRGCGTLNEALAPSPGRSPGRDRL